MFGLPASLCSHPAGRPLATPRRKRPGLRLALALLAGTLLSALPPQQARAAVITGSVQLVLSLDQPQLLRNGESLRWHNPPRLFEGRSMVPLLETAGLLGQPLAAGATQLELGRLSVDTAANRALLSGVEQEGALSSLDGVLYVSVRTLADALDANLSADDETARTLTLTAVRGGGNPLLPQARFSTDKTVYAPGERVVYTEYPYDPDGADITARRWTGRQDVYFQPGTYRVGLTVTNSRGLQSEPFSRTITVQGAPIDSPLTYGLKYAQPGDALADPLVLTYPAAPAQPVPGETYPLLFSDSPEVPSQNGVLYQDSVTGRARLLGYHLNGLGRPARMYILARNTDTRAVEVRTDRLGETAPTRVESQLGQVTLLDYFASTGGATLSLAPGESAAVYASPTLNPGSGVNVMQDIRTTGRVEITFLMLEDGLQPSGQVVRQLPYLLPDSRHVRGTFPEAVRHLRVELGTLPARIVIGDGQVDPALTGVDVLSGQPVRLSGNYGVLYDLEVNGAAGTAVALSPRGGLYRGAMNIQDGPITQVIKLPRSGNALKPDQPVLLWRPQADRLNIDFVPASGSNLPVSLVFYRTRGAPGFSGGLKTYNP